MIRKKQELKEAPRTSCNGRIKFYVKSWVAWCNSSLFFSAQVKVFAIAQVPKFKSYFWKPKITLTLFGWPWLGLRNLECSCWKAAELLQLQLSFPAELNFSWVELLQLQLSWTSAELSFFSCSWAFQLSWTSAELNFLNSSWTSTSTGVQAGSTGVQGKFNRGPERFNRGPRKVQPGFFSRTSLVNTGWTGPRGGSTGVRTCFCSLTCSLPVWLVDCLSACPRRLNRS